MFLLLLNRLSILGASPFSAFFRVCVPLAYHGIFICSPLQKIKSDEIFGCEFGCDFFPKYAKISKNMTELKSKNFNKLL